MALEYCYLVTPPNIISSIPETLSNLTEWSFKVDYGMPWRIKVTSPFKGMSHTAPFKVSKISS